MTAQVIYLLFHLFPFLFRERRFTPILFSFLLKDGPVDFLGRRQKYPVSLRSPRWRGSRLFRVLDFSCLEALQLERAHLSDAPVLLRGILLIESLLMGPRLVAFVAFLAHPTYALPPL